VEIIFSNQSLLCLDVSFRQNCRHKKIAGKRFLLQSNTFFGRQMLFLQATLFIEKNSQ
jgi:hypothetical protein